MAKTYTAPFAQTPKTATAVVTGAATVSTNVPGNVVELLTAGAEGALVTRVTAMPLGTVTAAALVVYLSKDGGLTMRPVVSALLEAHTLEPTEAIPMSNFEGISDASPLRLEAGDKLYVGSLVENAAGIAFTASWMDY